MAIAKCGMIWPWGSPLWCSGNKKDNKIDTMCLGCPWFEGNKNFDEYEDA